MANWYYSVKGKAEGPVSEEFLLEGLKSGRFTLVDLAFREGEVAWCTLGEVPQFRDAVQALPAPRFPESTAVPKNTDFEFVGPVAVEDKTVQGVRPKDWETKPSWIVLWKRDKGFEQTGPFTVDALLEKLASGELEYSQYVWKPGYKRWVRIGNLPEFDRRKRDRSGDYANQIVPFPEVSPSVPALSRDELMESVMRVDRTDPVADAIREAERPPAETDGVDLARLPYDPIPFAAGGASPARSTSPEDLRSEPTVVGSIFPSSRDEATSIVTEAQVIEAQSPQKSPAAESSPIRDEFDDDFTPTDAKEMRGPRPGDPGTGKIPIESAEAKEVLGAAAISSSFDEAQERDSASSLDPDSDSGSDPSPEPGVLARVLGHHLVKLLMSGVAAGLLIVVGFRVLVLTKIIPTPDADLAVHEVPAPPMELVRETPPQLPRPPSTSEVAAVSEQLEKSAPDPASDPNLRFAKTQPQELESQVRAVGKDAAVDASNRSPAKVVAESKKSAVPKAPADPKAKLLSSVRPIPPGPGKASVLNILPLQVKGAAPLLVFQTNAGVGELISVTVKARTGEVLEVPSYYRTFQVRRSTGEVASVDIGSVPMGSYQVEARVGDLKSSKVFFVGEKNAAFNSKLQKYLKRVAPQQQAERNTLFYSAKKFESLARSLGTNYQRLQKQNSKWNGFYSKWKKDVEAANGPVKKTMAAARKGGLAYPEEFHQFRAAADELIKQGQVLDSAVRQKRQVASQKPLPIEKEFTRLKEEAARLSGRP